MIKQLSLLFLLFFITSFANAEIITIQKKGSKVLPADRSEDQIVDYLKIKLRKEASLEAGSVINAKSFLENGKISKEEIIHQVATTLTEEQVGSTKKRISGEDIVIEIKMKYSFDKEKLNNALLQLIANEEAFNELNKNLADKEKEIAHLKRYIEKLERTNNEQESKPLQKKDKNIIRAAQEFAEDGVAREYYSSGKLKAEVPTLYGLMEGVLLSYREDGSLIMKIPFKKGEKHGNAKIYYKNGEVSQQIHYKKGNIHGVRKWFNEDGDVILKAKYWHGYVVSGKCVNKRKLTKRELNNLGREIMPSCIKEEGLKLHNEELVSK